MDLSQRSDELRRTVLVTSGGWLGGLAVLVADVTGIWDVLVLAALFVLAWIVLRTSPALVAMILGFAFDITIPLQYHAHPAFSAHHAQHLAAYWPMLWLATLAEAAAFFLLHPDLFTLVVCVKTCACLGVWMARKNDGYSLGNSGLPPPPPPPVGSSPDRAALDRRLRAAGYADPAARAAMVDDYLSAPTDARGDKMARWLAETDPERVKQRMANYRPKRGGASRGSGGGGGGSGRGGGAPGGRDDWRKQLKNKGYSDDAADGMLDNLSNVSDNDAANKMKQYLNETPEGVDARNDRYKRKKKKRKQDGKRTGGGDNGEGTGARGGAGGGDGDESSGDDSHAPPSVPTRRTERLVTKPLVERPARTTRDTGPAPGRSVGGQPAPSQPAPSQPAPSTGGRSRKEAKWKDALDELGYHPKAISGLIRKWRELDDAEADRKFAKYRGLKGQQIAEMNRAYEAREKARGGGQS